MAFQPFRILQKTFFEPQETITAAPTLALELTWTVKNYRTYSKQDFVLKTGKRQCVKQWLSSLMINKGPLGETALASALRSKYSGVVTGK